MAESISVTTKVLVIVMTNHVLQYIVSYDMFLVGDGDNGNHWTITKNK